MGGGRPVIEIVTGQPGAGKSYSVVCWLMELYHRGYRGSVWTNLPLVAEKWTGCPIQALPVEAWMDSAEIWEAEKKRLQEEARREAKAKAGKARRQSARASSTVSDDDTAPEEGKDGPMLEAAASIIRREKMRGPWDLETRDGDILIVDEAHNVIPPVGICDYRKEWQRYLSELRHQGVTCVLISQDMDLMDRRCMLLAEQRTTLTNRANLKHIAFGCKAYFWYDVVHAFTGQPWFVFQKDVLLKYNGRWVPESSSPVVASLQVFESYQSRSKSYVTGKGAGDYAAPSRRKALRSFLWAAWPGLIVRAFVFSAIIWVVAFQGGGTAVNFIMKTMFRMAGNKTEQTAPGLVEAAVEDQGGGVLPEVERDYLEDLRVNLAARGLVLESCSPVPLREYWSDRELRADYRLKRIGSRVWLSARVSGSRRAGLQQFSKGFSQAGKGFKSLYERR